MAVEASSGAAPGTTGPGVGAPLGSSSSVRGAHRTPSLRGYAGFVRRQWALICVLALLGAAVGGLLVARSPASYAAETKVAVTPQPTGADLDPDRPRLVSLDSDAQILSSGAVLARAVETTGFPGGVPALRDALDVSALPNSRVLIVRVTYADRDLAIDTCGAIVTEFLRTRAESERARGLAASAAVSAQIADVLDRLAALRVAQADSPEPPVSSGVIDPAEPLLTRLQELEDELRVVSTAGAASPGTVVSAPTAPAAGSRPMAAATVVSGLLIGTLLGVGAASLRAGERSRTWATSASVATVRRRPSPRSADR